MSSTTIQTEIIEQKIYLIRGHKVMIDSDLALLYGVKPKRLNEQVKRNRDRFPADFMFQLNINEAEFLRSQFATSKKGRGGKRYLPFVFTQEGVAMLSSVLKSKHAIHVNIAIMRTFVKIRALLSSHADLLHRLNEMEERYEGRFAVIFKAIRELMNPESPKQRIGFTVEENNKD